MGRRPDIDYHLSAADGTHRDWDPDRDPVLTVDSGSVVLFDCPDASGGRVDPGMTPAEVAGQPFPGHALVGPVAVADARPDDVLDVEILGIDHDDWGYTYVEPGSGLLAGKIDGPAFRCWNLAGDEARFEGEDAGVSVPLAPFPGVVGVTPDVSEPEGTIPPRTTGGNLDVKHLTAGSVLSLPVAVDGGLLSIGDGHAAQGDGEVCLTGIETGMRVTVRVKLRSDVRVGAPHVRSPTSPRPSGPVHATTGIADSLETAARRAVWRQVLLLEDAGLSRTDAYMVCSAAADLRISELVNDPNKVVVAELPCDTMPGYP